MLQELYMLRDCDHPLVRGHSRPIFLDFEKVKKYLARCLGSNFKFAPIQHKFPSA